MKYEIWTEGFIATGMNGLAVKQAEEIEAGSFKEACDKFAEQYKSFKKYYDPHKLTFWGCRLFDNEEDARRSFG